MKLDRKLMMVSVAALMGVSPVLTVATNATSTVQAASVYKTYGKNSSVKTVKAGYFVDKNGKKTSKKMPKGGQYTIWEVEQIKGQYYFSIQSDLKYWMPASVTKGSVQYKFGNKTITIVTDGKGGVKTSTAQAKSSKKTVVKKTTKTTKKSTKTAKATTSKPVTLVTIRKVQVFDQNGKKAKSYMGSKKWTVIGKGVTVKGLGTKKINGEDYYALQPGKYYIKASDVKVK